MSSPVQLQNRPNYAPVVLSQQPPQPSNIQCDLATRICSLGYVLFFTAEAIGRIAVGCLALFGYALTLGNWQEAYLCGTEQLQRAYQAGSFSALHLHDMIWQFKAPNITPSTITSEPKSNKPSEPLTTEFSPSLLSPRAERIARSLQRQYNRAQAQAAAEQDQEFTYRPAPLGAFPSPFVDRTLQHLHEESASQRIGGYSSGFCHFIGRRNVMEDKHLSDTFNFPIQDTLHTAVIFGVFDGHGGNQAAEFVEKNLTAILQSTLAEHCKEGLTQERIRDALKETFRSLNKLFLPAQSGTTAALAMILGNRLWTANVGDSRIILDNGIQLTEDAKPTDPRYVKKITKLNGFVTNGRVNGTLAVARAIGDHHVRGMCAEATIIDHPISEIPENSHLILVCDGISDVASTRQMAQVVRNNNQLSAEVLARNLVFSAHSSFSGDNLSALVVKIKPTN